MKIEFENHIPDYCDPRGCKRERLYFDSLDELLEAKKEWLINEEHKDLIFSCGTYNTLMISSQSEEWWWVIGYVKGIDLSKYLPRFDEVYIKPKMSKELEALNEIRKCLYGDIYAGVERKLDIIETALKRLEIYENTKFIAMDSPEWQNKEWLKDWFEKPLPIIADATPLEIKSIYSEQDEKKLKAFEIIKTVCPNIFWVVRTYTYEEYKKKCPDDTLLQEEYDLLKEVLL